MIPFLHFYRYFVFLPFYYEINMPNEKFRDKILYLIDFIYIFKICKIITIVLQDETLRFILKKR